MVDTAKKHKTDLIAMITQGFTRWQVLWGKIEFPVELSILNFAIKQFMLCHLHKIRWCLRPYLRGHICHKGGRGTQ